VFIYFLISNRTNIWGGSDSSAIKWSWNFCAKISLIKLDSGFFSMPDIMKIPPWLDLLELWSDISSTPDVMVIPPWLITKTFSWKHSKPREVWSAVRSKRLYNLHVTSCTVQRCELWVVLLWYTCHQCHSCGPSGLPHHGVCFVQEDKPVNHSPHPTKSARPAPHKTALFAPHYAIYITAICFPSATVSVITNMEKTSPKSVILR